MGMASDTTLFVGNTWPCELEITDLIVQRERLPLGTTSPGHDCSETAIVCSNVVYSAYPKQTSILA